MVYSKRIRSAVPRREKPPDPHHDALVDIEHQLGTELPEKDKVAQIALIILKLQAKEAHLEE